MSQPRNFLLPGENETMHNIMQEHYRKTGQLDLLDPLADPVNLDFDAAEPYGLGFMELYPVHAVAVYMLTPDQQGEKLGVEKGWELLECWLEPTEAIAELPPRPPPEPEPEPDPEKYPWYLENKKRIVWTIWDIGTIDGTKIRYDVGDVDKLMTAFKDATARGGTLTMRFRPEPKDQNKFCSYADVGDPTSKTGAKAAAAASPPPRSPAAEDLERE